MLRKRQQGFTLITWLLILAIVAFVAMFVIKLIPVYLESFNVQASLSSLTKDSSGGGDTAADLLEKLNKRLGINDVEHVEKGDILIARKGPNFVVTIDYVRQVHFIGNIDFLVSFKFEEQVTAR